MRASPKRVQSFLSLFLVVVLFASHLTFCFSTVKVARFCVVYNRIKIIFYSNNNTKSPARSNHTNNLVTEAATV